MLLKTCSSNRLAKSKKEFASESEGAPGVSGTTALPLPGRLTLLGGVGFGGFGNWPALGNTRFGWAHGGACSVWESVDDESDSRGSSSEAGVGAR